MAKSGSKILKTNVNKSDSSFKYHKNTYFERAYQNMTNLVALRNELGLSKPQIEWKYVLFNWNDSPKIINKAISLAHKAGVDLISFWPTLSPPYGISWRYKFGKFKNVGISSWKGREVWLKNNL